jgi:hypothetical protein
MVHTVQLGGAITKVVSHWLRNITQPLPSHVRYLVDKMALEQVFCNLVSSTNSHSTNYFIFINQLL